MLAILYNYIQTKIQYLRKPLFMSTLFKPRNSKPRHIDNPEVFGTWTYFKLDTYSEACQRFKMDYFAKIVKIYNFFSKGL